MEHFESIVSSIRKKIPLSFIHYSYTKKLFKAIIIHPYLMKESNKRWYLVGYSEEHEAVRYFGLDRIYDPVLIDKAFQENKNADLRRLFDNKIGLSTISKKVPEVPEQIVLRVSRTMANYIKSMPLHKSQTHEEANGYGDLFVQLQLVPTYELLSLILSYGKDMELLQPAWLRKEIEGVLDRSVFKYKKSSRP
jgi:predicted DNA-binding transcriptional regulator YafY